MVNFATMPLETIWMISPTGADFWFQVGVGWVNWVVSPLEVVWRTASSPDIFFAFYPKIVCFEAFLQSLIISNCFLALQALHYTWLHHVKPKSRAKTTFSYPTLMIRGECRSYPSGVGAYDFTFNNPILLINLYCGSLLTFFHFSTPDTNGFILPPLPGEKHSHPFDNTDKCTTIYSFIGTLHKC